MPPPFELNRRIADPIHKTIGLTELESKVISTQAFIRLHGIKQLGMAFQVFPGAGYSRFSHSLGACHVMGRILDSMMKRHVIDQDDQLLQKYRLAALLHDIGHYPFSHTTEHAIEDHYKGEYLRDAGGASNGTDGGGAEVKVEKSPEDRPYYTHERVGKSVLLEDDEIKETISGFGFDPKEIYQIFTREQPIPLANLISSDLDADRIDYLLRTAHHTGLPYGSPDLEYMLTQFFIDDEQRICISAKAIRTVEHFLFSRYFDYQQVAYHKTVVALEWALERAVTFLLRTGAIDLRPDGVDNLISSHRWRTFDDGQLLELLRIKRDEATETEAHAIAAVLDRKPAKVVGEREIFDQRDSMTFPLLVRQIEAEVDGWSAKFGIPREAWRVWTVNMDLTKIGSSVPVSRVYDDDGSEKDAYEQAVRISHTDGSSEPIVQHRSSMMHVLADSQLQKLRVYVQFPDSDESQREEIETAVEAKFLELKIR